MYAHIGCSRRAGVVRQTIYAPSILAQPIGNHVASLWRAVPIDPAYCQAMQSAFEVQRTRPSVARGRPLAVLALPGLCCAAMGSPPQRAHIVAASWALLYTAAHILDNVEDGDSVGEPWAHWGTPAAINIATGLMVSASSLLNKLDETTSHPAVAHAIRNDFYCTGLRMCAGQHADLTCSGATLEQCWRMVEAKTGAFFELACRAGCRLATTDPVCIDRFGEFGRHLGVLLQISDDLSGLWSTHTHPSDIRASGCWTLPLAYTMAVLPTDQRQSLHGCLKRIPVDPQAESEVRRRILDAGAILYLAVTARQRLRRARAALCAAAPPSPARGALLALLRRTKPLRLGTFSYRHHRLPGTSGVARSGYPSSGTLRSP